MALAALDRLLTIVVTATLTSAVWIVGGEALLRGSGGWSGTFTQGATTERTSAAGPAADEGAERAAGGSSFVAGGGGGLVIPVAGVARHELVDTFTQARAGGTRVHDAIDIMAPRGTPVVAAAPGRVEKLFLSRPGGKTIYIRSADGRTIYYYAHLDSYRPGLAEGQQVRAGEPLGTVGFSGNADPAAPHLHFAIMRTTPQAKWWEPATAVNPYPLLTAR